MKLRELAALMNISKEELIEQMNSKVVIELKLVEKSEKVEHDNGKIEVLN
jgi:hypothetical protein